ncbi:Zn-dependent hydrolase/oxidoreductase [Coccidioides posadasii str. Silveira]|uniref:Zn-dependent hydrolase/oxidoreductase n=1 Tax=Coccidioides posadasii (strain RMSCC 757 / Silveira) TaxID=443226 RepID=E9CXH9_COCPS|nr:Zn-dependent hydrolase/oxidoreductase [Coccidioides posadasii str. Silveira]
MAASTAAAVLHAATLSIPSQSPVPEDAEAKAHHVKSGGFRNPWASWHMIPAFTIVRKMIARRFSGEANVPDTTPPTVPVRKPEFLPSRQTPKLRATWLGHACYYVEFPSGLRVLFDPVFEDRCSPFSWLGPKRYTEMPCKMEDIPFIDAVLDWWEERDIALSPLTKSAEVTSIRDASDKASNILARIGCLPCQHISARTLWDRSQTLWGSWSVESGSSKVYFAGDTGYRSVPELPKEVDDYGPGHNYPHCPAFAQVGQYRGPFTLGLIPIGAYDPRFIMSPMHADPHDAVNIFKDTKCQNALGMHWGTWVLTEEDVLEPPRKLKKALRQNGIAETGVFDVCDIGESREF